MVFPHLSKVFPRLSKVFPRLSEVFPHLSEDFPRLSKVFPPLYKAKTGLFTIILRYFIKKNVFVIKVHIKEITYLSILRINCFFIGKNLNIFEIKWAIKNARRGFYRAGCHIFEEVDGW